MWCHALSDLIFWHLVDLFHWNADWQQIQSNSKILGKTKIIFGLWSQDKNCVIPQLAFFPDNRFAKIWPNIQMQFDKIWGKCWWRWWWGLIYVINFPSTLNCSGLLLTGGNQPVMLQILYILYSNGRIEEEIKCQESDKIYELWSQNTNF